MSKVRILIVEDEALVAADLSTTLQSYGYEVLEIVDSAPEAIKALNIYQIDLVLLDIKIKGKQDGVSIAKHINEFYKLPVIFISSLIDKETVDRAISAKPSAYIVKPFNQNELQIAIEMALKNFSENRVANAMGEVESPQESAHYLLNKRIFVKSNYKFERVNYSDIYWLEAESNYVKIVTASKKYLLSLTLGALHEKLKDPVFLRIHRSYVVNLEQVDGLQGNTLMIKGEQIPISKGFRDEVYKHFKLI